MTTPSPDRSRQPVRRVVIAGGGTAGWMTAACLSNALGKGLDIKLVESDEIGTVGVGEATIPTLLTFNSLAGINEPEFMAETQAVFKLGIQFEGWRDIGEDYIHSFGNTGQDHWTAGFQHFWLKGRDRKLARRYGEYCLELRAAEQSRFAHLPRNGMNYAFHLDATLYARYLRRLSEARGVKRIEGKIAEVMRHPDGDISAIKLADGSVLEGDLFVDCTGMRGLLIGDTLGVKLEDWSHWLPCDRAIALQTQSVAPPIPYVRAIAHPFGWQWQIPLQHRVGNGIVFSGKHVSDDEALSTLMGNIQGEVLTKPRVIPFKPCQRETVWERNCVAIGLSSGFLEPLESTSIHLIQRGIIRLLQCFPNMGVRQVDIDEYNKQTRDEMEHIRDFIILHYKVTNRSDSDFWNQVRTMDVPASLQHRIDLFRESGRVFRAPHELFAENSWIQVMLGQGITPTQHHHIADLMDDRELNGFLEEIRGQVERTLAQLPTHADYVAQYCKAAAPPVKTTPAAA